MTKEDNHLHSDFSDGYDSIDSMAKAAKECGVSVISITDHVNAKSVWIGDYIKEIEAARRKYPEVEIKIGVEAKVVDTNGNIDFDGSWREKVDIVLAAFHRLPSGKYEFLDMAEAAKDKEAALELWRRAMLNVLDNKMVDIIAHPGEILKKYGIELPKDTAREVAEKAQKNGKIFEINKRYGLPEKGFLRELEKSKVSFSLGSDSHSVEEFKKYNSRL